MGQNMNSIDHKEQQKEEFVKIETPQKATLKLYEAHAPEVLETSSVNNLNKSDNLSDESDSFIIVNESSLDASEASSLGASDVDIQRKSMSIDHNAIISSLTMYEMQQQLSNIMQENIMLKEALTQNTSDTEQCIVLSKIHEALMERNSQKQLDDSTTTVEVKDSKQDIKNMDKSDASQQTVKILDKAVKSLASKTNTKLFHKWERTQSTPDLKKSDNIEKHTHVTSSLRLNLEEAVTVEELEKMEKEIESGIKSDVEATSESEICTSLKSLKLFEDQEDVEISFTDSEEIACLNQKIATLVKQSQHVAVFTPIQLCAASEEMVAKESSIVKVNHKILSENIRQYNDTLEKLNEYFLAEITRFIVVEKYIKKIKKLFMTRSTYCNKLVHDLIDEEHDEEDYKQLCHYGKQLAKEHVDMIVTRENLLKAQNQFQKIFWDYQTVLYELEITTDENTKLNMLNASEKLQQVEKSEHIKCEKQNFEEFLRNFLSQEGKNLQKEKALLEKDQEQLQQQEITLLKEKELLKQQQVDIQKEKTILNHKYEMYENIIEDLQQQISRLNKNCDVFNQLDDANQKITGLTSWNKRMAAELSRTEEELRQYEEYCNKQTQNNNDLRGKADMLDMQLTKQIEYSKKLHNLLRSHGIQRDLEFRW